MAGRLATGLSPQELGPAGCDLVPIQYPLPERTTSGVRGEVLYVDSFGNLITNLQVDEDAVVYCASRRVGLPQRTYGESPPGTLIALSDSQGRLEIAVVNAARPGCCRRRRGLRSNSAAI